MHNQDLGRVAVVSRGAYDPAAEYERLDAVSYNGSSYLVRKHCQGVEPAEGEYYMLMAKAGDSTAANAAAVEALAAAERANTTSGRADTAAGNANAAAAEAKNVVNTVIPDVNKLKDDLCAVNSEIIGEESDKSLLWEQGNFVNYNEQESSTRIRTGYVKINTDAKIKLSAENGYKFYWYLFESGIYDKSKSSNAWVTSAELTVSRASEFRLVGAKADDTTIIPTDGKNINFSVTIARNIKTSELEDFAKYLTAYSPVLGGIYVNGTDAESTTRIRTEYFKARKGSVIINGKPLSVQFYVHEYDKSHTRTGGSTEWHTYKSYVISADCEVRVVCRYDNEPTVTDVDALAKSVIIRHANNLYDIAEKANSLDAFAHKVEPYFIDEVDATIKSAIIKMDEKCLVFAVLTDSHADTYYRALKMKETANNIRAVADKVSFDGIIHMGDVITGTTSGLLKSYELEYMMLTTKALKDIGLPLYMIGGNHDDNSEGNVSNPENLIGDADRYAVYGHICDKDIIRNGVIGNYYKDYPHIKIRVVWLSGIYNDYTWTGYTQEQVDWMTETLENAPNDYKFVVFSHFPTRAENNNNSGAVVRGEKIENALNTVSDRVIAFIHGHTHADKISDALAYPSISICCNLAEKAVSTIPEGAVTYDRANGTVTQDCWEVVIIKESGSISLVRFGAGSDREIQKN